MHSTPFHASLPAAVDDAADSVHDLALDGFSYEPRSALNAALERALMRSGCWLLDQRTTSVVTTELRFELQLGAIVELYAGLVSAGLELTRAGHTEITGLCTLRKHRSRPSGSVLTVRLTVQFLDEVAPRPTLFAPRICA